MSHCILFNGDLFCDQNFEKMDGLTKEVHDFCEETYQGFTYQCIKLPSKSRIVNLIEYGTDYYHVRTVMSNVQGSNHVINQNMKSKCF